MGSIVKTIGKVIKKIGKVLKKIAPILLVAAVAYIGYGYMTGFQQGGWPQITDWGKSLMGGVSQGQTLSQAANAAGGIADPAAQAVTTPLTEAPDVVAQPISDAVEPAVTEALTSVDPSLGETADSGLIGTEDGMGLPTEGGLLSEIQDTTNTRFTSLMDSWDSNRSGVDNVVNKSWSDWIMSPSKAATAYPPSGPSAGMNIVGYGQGGLGDIPPRVGPVGTVSTGGATESFDSVLPIVNTPAVNQTAASTAVAQNQAVTTGLGGNPYLAGANQYGIPAGSHMTDQSFLGIMAGLGKKAWGIYKGMWKDNPWMAAWTTQKVIETIAALLDDTAEKESYRSRHVAGFEPGNWGDLRKKYGGNLPGGPATGVWAGDKSRQTSLRTGPQIAGRIPTSAIDRKPQGMIGPKVERALS